MRIFYWVMGGLLAALGLRGLWGAWTVDNPWSDVALFGPAAASGGILLWAAARNFRGHWALPIALIQLSSPGAILSLMLDDHAGAEAHFDAIVTTGVAAAFGLLLLVTAWRFDRMTRIAARG
ncbi:MAG TPA: hypothetical protein VG838_15895 [Opitutaceae bacterium]|nr:hypothetical protein [Opitutaceae bacterium]